MKNSPKCKDIKEKLSKIKGVSNIADDILVGNLELKFKVNTYGQKLGFTENYILSSIRPMYFKGAYSKMFDDEGIVDVVFQSKNKDDLKSLDYFELLIPGTKQKVLFKRYCYKLLDKVHNHRFSKKIM